MRRGLADCDLWLCDRVFNYPRLSEPQSNPITYYTLVEASRLVGVTYPVLQRILPQYPPAVLASPDIGGKPFPLWPESFLLQLRKSIARGIFKVRQSSLTAPKFGVRLCSPRHVHAEDQAAEAGKLRRAQPMDSVIW